MEQYYYYHLGLEGLGGRLGRGASSEVAAPMNRAAGAKFATKLSVTFHLKCFTCLLFQFDVNLQRLWPPPKWANLLIYFAPRRRQDPAVLEAREGRRRGKGGGRASGRLHYNSLTRKQDEDEEDEADRQARRRLSYILKYRRRTKTSWPSWAPLMGSAALDWRCCHDLREVC